MATLTLQRVGEKRPWALELTDQGAMLKDAQGTAVLMVKRSECLTKILVPGKLMSGSNIVILAEGPVKHEFKYDKGLVTALRTYQDSVLAADPEAVQNLKAYGRRLMILSLVMGGICWFFILVMFFVEPFRSMKTFRHYLALCFIFLGFRRSQALFSLSRDLSVS